MIQIISGKHRGRKLKTPRGEGTRPTTSQLRETLFNICQTQIEDSTFLDLFAGTGAIGLEALSRGAAQVTFIEKDRNAAALIRDNLDILGEKGIVLALDVTKALPLLLKQKKSFTLIYVDPPYGDTTSSKSNEVLQWIDAHPQILKPGGHLFLEDVKEASDEVPLHNLQPQRRRRVGKAYLRHFCHPSSP